MNDNAPTEPGHAPSGDASPGPGEPDPTEIARRIDERRDALGLSEAELAAKAGMATRYLQHLAEAGPAFDPGGFLRLASALGLSHRELVEGGTDRPPGQGRAPEHPVLVQLGVRECWERIGDHGVGRVALPAGPGPAVLPVNYVVDARTIAYRTTPHSAAAPDTGTTLSFQIDRIDEKLSRGWSVLLAGTAEHVTTHEEIERLNRHPGSEPWAGGDNPLWIRIRPTRVTGRRVGSL
ncbi:helix-turn-helix domain-containing protein [Kitasatospora sp. DSM 101779]|uniref:helix-turn-helix domain-containing protein n=1 Tax=Kitasatospora sp. DSM 101779 TaxID=2853165 RepID=UPI0021D8E977|nr:pyridoxamine 5'-phosphate oxidase family protein [Kitasatospora sp. DSM 101779]MCU7821269.1 pyridoxamine 5'-phosphate oxidase family protein [Kitasatospora sp. DSM 101779]